jgi:hypothetical protein
MYEKKALEKGNFTSKGPNWVRTFLWLWWLWNNFKKSYRQHIEELSLYNCLRFCKKLFIMNYNRCTH